MQYVTHQSKGVMKHWQKTMAKLRLHHLASFGAHHAHLESFLQISLPETRLLYLNSAVTWVPNQPPAIEPCIAMVFMQACSRQKQFVLSVSVQLLLCGGVHVT